MPDVICVIVCNLYYCCYAKTSSSAVQKRHSKVYGNPIAPSFYSILLGCYEVILHEHDGKYLKLIVFVLKKVFKGNEEVISKWFFFCKVKIKLSCLKNDNIFEIIVGIHTGTVVSRACPHQNG